MTVKLLLSWALYAATWGCFLAILGHCLYHKSWKNFFICLVFALMCSLLGGTGGMLIALVIGWQEAGKWKIKNLMRAYTVLIFFYIPVYAMDKYHEEANRPVEVPKGKTKQELMKKIAK